MVKNLPVDAGDKRDTDSIPGVKRIPWRRRWPEVADFEDGGRGHELRNTGSL